MGLLFLVKQHAPELAAAEAKAAVHGWGWWAHDEPLLDGAIFFPQARKARTNLGLTRRIVKVILACNPADLPDVLEEIAWGKYLRGTYRVSLTGKGHSERELATLVWRSAQGTVDLRHPDTVIDIVIAGGMAFVGTRAWESSEDFEARRTHLLPAPHPSGMHPAIARALANLACARRIHDPMCGAGGILIEAGLGGMRASGADIEPSMVARARSNCAHFGLRPDLRIADAVQWMPRAGAVIADLPFGKSTRPKDAQALLEAVLARAGRSTSRAVIGAQQQLHVPSTWRRRAHFSLYVHRGMTRHFLVLERGP